MAACAKHFVANDSETERLTVDVRVDDATLRELYLLPFEMTVAAGVWLVMVAYNSVGGTTMTEHGPLVNGLLKGEWGFDGVVVSDWLAARSTAEAALGGLDVAMPAVANPWTQGQLLDAVRSGRVPETVIEDKARRVLRLAARVGLPGQPSRDEVGLPDGREVARVVAERSFVLARNDGLLPLADAGTVAVLGIAAQETRAMGGGSAEVVPERVVSILDGLRARFGERIGYEIGVDPRQTLPKAAGPQWSSLRVTCRDAHGAELWGEPLVSAGVRWIGDPPAAGMATAEIEGEFTPGVEGEHTFSVRGVGAFRLDIGGETVWQDAIWPDVHDPAGFLFPPEHRVRITLGHAPVPVKLVHEVMADAPFPAVSFHLGHLDPRPSDDELLERAVALAADSDVAVVVVGTTEHVESEGFDRESLALPGRQDELVERVLAVNPRTVVLVNSGAPVLMPWADRVPALMLCWFPRTGRWRRGGVRARR